MGGEPATRCVPSLHQMDMCDNVATFMETSVIVELVQWDDVFAPGIAARCRPDARRFC